MMKIKFSSHPLLLVVLPVTLLLAPLPSLAESHASKKIDPDSGLIVADGWKIVKANCIACHSARLVTQNNGTRARWESLIRWMQDTQGLWQFPAETETTILDYLTEHYGPRTDARRAPLLPSQLPINPYDAKKDKEKSATGEPAA